MHIYKVCMCNVCIQSRHMNKSKCMLFYIGEADHSFQGGARAGLSKGLRGAIAQGHHMIGGTTWADCRINIFRINIIFLCGTYIYSPIILIHLTNTNFYGFLAYLHAGGKGGLFPAPASSQQCYLVKDLALS